MTAREAYDLLVQIRDHPRWGELTAWEQGFVQSLRAQAARKDPPTAKQGDILRRIATKFGVSYGLTADEESLWR